MKNLKKYLVLLIVVFFFSNNICCASTYDATGNWQATITDVYSNCPVNINTSWSGQVVINQSGDNFNITVLNENINMSGTVDGANYIASSSNVESAGSYTAEINRTTNFTLNSLSSVNGIFSATASDISDGTYLCNWGHDVILWRDAPAVIWYRDIDNDGYGNPQITISSDSQPEEYVSNSSDCDDYDASIYPGASEIQGDGIDQDCDGSDLSSTDSSVVNFVTRFYQQCLSREPDTGGLNGWVNDLNDGLKAGNTLAEAFIFSSEFQNRNTSNSEFLTILYKAFFDREPDTNGYNYWINNMSNGASRSDILAGFTSSPEFITLCQDYGISPNAPPPNNDNPVAEFVTRFYQQCLSREPDTGGLNGWVNDLNDGLKAGDTLAEAFIFSSEFQNRNTSNSEFLTILYKAFFDREPDTNGYNNWINRMSNGASRSDILAGFTSAQEFINLCSKYQIKPTNSSIATGCDSSNLNLCTAEGPCLTAGGYWYNNTCNSTQEGGFETPNIPVLSEYQSNPLISSYSTYPTKVYKHDDEFRMFFLEMNSYGSGPVDYNLDLMTSSDGFDWSNTYNNIISSQESGQTFNYYAGEVKEGNLYKIWHSATSDWNIAATKLYYSTSLDGVNYNGNATLVMDNGPYPAYDSRNINDPYVVFDGAQYHLYYTAIVGYQSGSPASYPNRQMSIAYATSYDGISWTKHGSVIEADQNNTFESYIVSSPVVIYDGSHFEMFYTGSDGVGGSGNGFAVSPDGLNWEKFGEVDTIDGTVIGAYKESGKYHVWYRGKDSSNQNTLNYAFTD